MATTARPGFTTQQPWIALVIVAILVAVAIPVWRTARRDAARRAGLRALVNRVIARQSPKDTLPTGYASAFPVELIPHSGQRVSRWVSDSAGWSAIVKNDSVTRGETTCGAFHGPLARPLHAGAVRPDTVYCW
ncbi:MAG: hypothetical protein HYX65_05555 [Gemmatimonadetes bacterium]|nr:hypothetical protein [Gemmatimonadota bacterium]